MVNKSAQKRQIQKIVKKVLRELHKYKPFVFSTAMNRESVYIHFKNLPNNLTHKLRISTHNERSRYGYKWQIRIDNDPIERKQWSKYFHDVEYFLLSFQNYYSQIEKEQNDK